MNVGRWEYDGNNVRDHTVAPPRAIELRPIAVPVVHAATQVPQAMDITNFIISRREQALLLGDYSSYRAQTSRRLHTLRRKLNRTSSKGRKYVGGAPITAADVASNVEFAQILLLTAERAWAHAMHMKSTRSDDTSAPGTAGPTRRHIISRLHKASRSARMLVTLLQDRAQSGARELDVLEGEAYALSLDGMAEFERKRWRECLTSYAVVRVIYAAVSASATTDVFKEVLANTVDPSIRYAAYQCRMPRTLAVPVIAQRCFPRDDPDLVATIERIDPEALGATTTTATKETSSPSDQVPKTITWRSRTVNLEDAAIALALASVATASAELSRVLLPTAGQDLPPGPRATAYDEVLTASQDAVDATKRALDEMAAEGVSPSDPRMQALQITRTAVSYELLSWRVGRNRVLTGERDGLAPDGRRTTKPRQTTDGTPILPKEEGLARKLARLSERVVLYGATLQSIDAVGDLAGVAADGDLVKELQVQRAYFEALKCLSIARAHALLLRRPNALALCTHASDLLRRTPHAASSSVRAGGEPPRLNVRATEVRALQELIQGETWRYHGLVELDALSATPSAAGNGTAPVAAPLIDDLSRFPTHGADLLNLVTYPPSLEPVPVKPLFLDVAWNYVDHAPLSTSNPARGLKEANGRDAPEQSGPTAKKGWFGFGR
ncbi:MAG: hypothetical protein M1838_002463 [Thelocarpon superellum]|nr:MAG: hypothetical protein M1838_002463 [Thelocarpon superellum]